MYTPRPMGEGKASMLRERRGMVAMPPTQHYGRKALCKTLAHLKQERSSWDSHYAELGRFQLPRVPRFYAKDRNKGGKKHRELYNDAATRALRVGAAGMMAGTCNPSTKWFEITTADPELALHNAAALWLQDSGQRMRTTFERANTYLSVHSMYESKMAFGTACNVVLPDRDTAIWHYPSPIGEFYAATDYRGIVATLYRVYAMTVREIVEQFGIENCSEEVRRLQAQGSLEEQVEVCNAIERRRDRNPELLDNLNMPWKSCWFETAADDAHDVLLRESGFRRFPALVSRWWLEGNDVYGGCPGMDALGKIKGLQLRELEQAQAIEYSARPPMFAHSSLKGRGVNLLPHGITYGDNMGTQPMVRPAYEINPATIPHMRADMDRVEAAINEAYLKDLFLMMSQVSDTTQRTAEEIIERRQEKLIVLGPAYFRAQRELLSPLVELCFWEMFEQGRLAPLPEVLEGAQLNIKFVSVMAQALQRVGQSDQDQFVVRLGAVARMKPEVLDRFDPDGWVDSQETVVDPRILVPRETAQQLRQARLASQAAMAQAQMMEQQAATAKDLSQAQTSQPSVLTGLAGAGAG